MKNIDLIRQEARAIIKQAGEIILQEKRSLMKIVTKSNEFDLVTQLDLKIEKFLKEELSKLLPNSKFIAEETDSKLKEYPLLWVIDPLDGTTNYVHNLPFFAVSVALMIDNRLELGFVYNPVMDEFFEAERGKGALLNGEKISVSTTDELSKALLATGFGYNYETAEENNLKFFDHFLMKGHGIRRLGSAAIDLCYVACGIYGGYWEWYLSPWDVAAGILIVEEAGGKVSKIDDLPYNFGDLNILASNGKIHDRMVEEFSKV